MIIGVSIGTSLILPLCVTGYGVSIRDYAIAWDSAQLFFTNTFLIGLSLFLTIRLLQYSDFKHHRFWKFGLAALPIFMIGLFFVYTTVETTIIEYHAKRFVEANLSDHYLLAQTIDEQQQSIALTLVGEVLSAEELQKLASTLSDYNLKEYQLDVTFYATNQDGTFDASVLAKILKIQNEVTSKFLGLD